MSEKDIRNQMVADRQKKDLAVLLSLQRNGLWKKIYHPSTPLEPKTQIPH